MQIDSNGSCLFVSRKLRVTLPTFIDTDNTFIFPINLTISKTCGSLFEQMLL